MEEVSTPPSKAVQDYLKTLHRLGGAERLVSPVDIAVRLDVRAPSVTGMLKRLSELGYIQYESGKGARLTAFGTIEARRVIRRHRLVELFLHQVLKLDWSEIDAEAEALEHAISPRLEQALAHYLGEPVEDPHGHPIPSRDGQITCRSLLPISTFQPGDKMVVREVPDEHPDRLRRWQELGLLPGAQALMVSHQPLDDLYELKIGSKVVLLGREGLTGIMAERVKE
ncbi:MAG: metal-dependent transcriptional regulator [Planctomycetia bacterium]|nr:metal-dependent transcriptional regulator [Planctomycetia bacterium]